MDPTYLVPDVLSVGPTKINRVELIGGCIFDRWPDVVARGMPEARVVHRQLLRPGVETHQPMKSDLRLVQIPLRYLYTERLTMEHGGADPTILDAAFERSIFLLREQIAAIDHADADRPTLFLNYPLPQRTPLGRLQPRYDLNNPAHYIERLNRELDRIVGDYAGGHVLDLDQIAAAFGRRLVQDDAFWIFAHGGMIDDADHHMDKDRLEQELPLSARYDFQVDNFIDSVWLDAVAMLRTIRGTDRVKMVCVDLDDTLWRGVLAEANEIDPTMVEGWPIGFAEALMVLKQRGIILAIVSRNDEPLATEIMAHLFNGRIKMTDFPIRFINWQPKAENVAAAIAAANLLPDSVLFIDDNPAERAAVEQALPGIRTLGAPHLDWRRILLWSAETQVPVISPEAKARNDMMRAQVDREHDRASTSHDTFLEHLDARIVLRRMQSVEDPAFERAFELLNKTNQFNTTGVRWTRAEASEYFADGGLWWAFSGKDRYTSYGLIGLLAIRKHHLDQFVLSCRVFGLGMELAALNTVERLDDGIVTASLVETPRNGPSRDVFTRAGWEHAEGLWRSTGRSPQSNPVEVSLQPAVHADAT